MPSSSCVESGTGIICCVSAGEHTCRRQFRGKLQAWCSFSQIIFKPGQQWFGAAHVWQGESEIETYVSAVWQPGQREAWFLISDRSAGGLRVKEYALRMRVESTFQDAQEPWVEPGRQLGE